MRKNLLWFGAGLLLMSFVVFLLRKVQVKFFQDNMSLFILLAIISLGVVLYGLIKKK